MSFHFKKVRKSLVECDFVIEDQTLHLWLNANILTPNRIKEVNKKLAEAKKISEDEIDERGSDFIIEMLVIMIDHWDAEDAKPEPQFFVEQSIVFLGDLYDVCFGAVFPKAKTAGASGDS